MFFYFIVSKPEPAPEYRSWGPTSDPIPELEIVPSLHALDETMSLRESSCSPLEESSEGSDHFDNETPVLSGSVKEQSFVLFKFEKKKTVLYYVGQTSAGKVQPHGIQGFIFEKEAWKLYISLSYNQRWRDR